MSAPHPHSAPATAHRRRYRRILRFAAFVLVQQWWYELTLPRLGLRRITERTRTRRSVAAAARFRTLALELGGLMIKVGQFLSSRLDVLPAEVTAELAALQDAVPPVPFEQVAATIASELGVAADDAFDWLDPEPLAAASLGQAHRARLRGQDASETGFVDAVVKVQRPGIDEIVQTDLQALRKIAGWLTRVRIVADRVDAPALVESFAATSLEELDYLHEARSAARFSLAFAQDASVRVPEIAWELSRRRVLVLEDVTGMKLDDAAGLAAAGIDAGEVARRLARTMFQQLFRDGFFHADPHPGNLFVIPDQAAPEGFQIAFIDFGMMGEVAPTLRSGLRHLVIAVATRDSAGLLAAADEVGVLLPGADRPALARALQTLFDRFGGMALTQLQDVDQRELERFASEFSDVMRTMPFQLPEDLLLLIRAVSLTSGVCSALDPDFNVWQEVEPFAADLAGEQGATGVRSVVTGVADAISTGVRLPGRIDAMLTTLEGGALRVDVSTVERRLDRLEGIGQRILAAVLFAALLIAGALLRAPDPVLSTVLLLSAVLPLIAALLPRSRRRR